MRFTDPLLPLSAETSPTSRSGDRPARRSHLLALLLVLFASACGGSGSSGFDSEAEVILAATSERICVEFAGSTWCGSGAPVGVGDDEAVLEFDERQGPLPCAELPEADGCEISVGFESSGFPEGSVFLSAWAADENGPWRLAPLEPPTSPSGGEGGDVVVFVPDAAGSPTPGVIAVLVYFDGPPDDLAEVEAELASFRADVLYLTTGVEVAPPSID